MKIPAPYRNLREAQAFARKWVGRIGEEWNLTRVPLRTHTNAHRLVAWAERHLPAPTNRR